MITVVPYRYAGRKRKIQNALALGSIMTWEEDTTNERKKAFA